MPPAAFGGGWWLYQRQRQRGQAVGSTPRSPPDPEKACLASSAESLSSWSSSDGAKRLDSRSSGDSAPPRRQQSRRLPGGAMAAGAAVADALPRRAESVRSSSSRRSDRSALPRSDSRGSLSRLPSGGGSMLCPDSTGSLQRMASAGAKFAQPGATAAGAGLGWGFSPQRSLQRGGSGTWGEDDLEVARSGGSGGSLRRTASDAGGSAPALAGSLHRTLSGPSAPAGGLRVYVPATPPKATKYLQAVVPLRSPSKSPSTKLPKVNE